MAQASRIGRANGKAGAARIAVLGLAMLIAYPSAAAWAENRTQSSVDSPEEIQVTSLAHPGTSVRWGRAEGLVHAPIAEVMKVVSNYGAYHEFMPHFRASRVLSQRGQRALVYMEAGVAQDTLTIWAQLKISPKANGATQVIEARMMKGNLDHMEAQWELTPIDATRTRVVFQILVDPKVPLPASLVSRENEKASRQTIGALRKRLKARG